MQELMFVYLLPRKKIRSEHTGKNAGSVRGATAGQARQVEELNARAFASQRGSPRRLRLEEWRPMNWGIQYIYGVAIGAG